jgi:hypothetical protein
MANMLSGVSKKRARALFPALALTAFVMLVGASSALGQAAVDQYVPSATPSGNHGGPAGGGGGGGGSTGSGGTAAGGATAGGATAGGAPADAGNGSLSSGGAGLTSFSGGDDGSGSTSGGSAPGTDYPLTTFVFIVIGLLAAVALAIVIIRRRRAGHTA